MGDMFEYTDARLQDEKNRQNSIETDDEEIQLEWYRLQKNYIFAEKEYKCNQVRYRKRTCKKGFTRGIDKD